MKKIVPFNKCLWSDYLNQEECTPPNILETSNAIIQDLLRKYFWDLMNNTNDTIRVWQLTTETRVMPNILRS